jgi:hypothetical protein
MHSFARFKKSRRKITEAFTPQAGTAFSVSGGAGLPAPLLVFRLIKSVRVIYSTDDRTSIFC